MKDLNWWNVLLPINMFASGFFTLGEVGAALMLHLGSLALVSVTNISNFTSSNASDFMILVLLDVMVQLGVAIIYLLTGKSPQA